MTPEERERKLETAARYRKKNAEKLRIEAAARYRENREKYRARRKKQYWEDPEKAKQYSREHRAKNRERLIAYDKSQYHKKRLAKYGITPLHYDMFLASQENKCAICKADSAGARNWHIDHCHRTKKVRGLLCHHCNLMLGNARDSWEILSNAMYYLVKSEASNGTV